MQMYHFNTFIVLLCVNKDIITIIWIPVYAGIYQYNIIIQLKIRIATKSQCFFTEKTIKTKTNGLL